MKWTVTACWLSQKSWHMTEWGRVIILYCNDSMVSISTGWKRRRKRKRKKKKRKKRAWVLYRILSLSSMELAINNVTNLCNCGEDGLCVWVSVYLDLLSHFLPFKIHLTNISPILSKMVDFKNLAWATSFATQARRKFIYLPYRASGEKSYCHTLVWCPVM